MAINTTYRHNEQIRVPSVQLIDHNDKQLGIVPTQQALIMAREAELDLVEVAPALKPPVCRIMDFGKWRYQQQKKTTHKASTASQIKEVRVGFQIGDADLAVRMNQSRAFVKDGHPVQVVMILRGRQLAHQDVARAIVNKIRDHVADITRVERDTRLEGKRMTMLLMPDARQKAKVQAQNAARPVTGNPGARIGPGPAIFRPEVGRTPAPAPVAPAPAPAAPAPEAPAPAAPAAVAPVAEVKS